MSRSIYFKADILFDRFLAGLAPPGSLSMLTLSRQLYTAGHQVVNRAVTAPVIPVLARLAAEGQWPRFLALRRARVRWATAGAAASILLLLVLGRPVLHAFFANGRFRPEPPFITSSWEPCWRGPAARPRAPGRPPRRRPSCPRRTPPPKATSSSRP
jgi:peptidoglycan biosynthesis protein MviN/MurJ (putative lipid II flippase)